MAVRIRRMSKERKALFALHPWCDDERANKLHRQMEEGYDKLIELYSKHGGNEYKFTDDRENNGNQIIRNFLESNSPEQEQARMEKYANRQRMFSAHMVEFQQIFGVQLRKYWGGPMLGLDIPKLDEDVVKSPDDMSMKDTIQKRFGGRALYIIESLMGK